MKFGSSLENIWKIFKKTPLVIILQKKSHTLNIFEELIIQGRCKL